MFHNTSYIDSLKSKKNMWDKELRQKNTTTLILATLFTLLLLAPILTPKVSTQNDTPDSPLVSAFAYPTRIQERDNTTITVEIRQAASNQSFTFGINTTNPSGTSSVANLTVTADATGFGSASIEYWKEFAAGNTDYVGEYSVNVKNLTTNASLAITSFTVGLTDKLQYARNETVTIQASGYTANENLTLNIKLNETLVDGPINLTASPQGTVNLTWQTPVNAVPGLYTVSITNATSPGTVKNPPDSQDFYIEVWQVQIWARNLANEPIVDLTIKAGNLTIVPVQFFNLSQATNETGWASFMLATGNYTFKAFWKQKEVGTLPLPSLKNDTVLDTEGWIQLSNLRIKVIDEATGEHLPFVRLRLEYNYTNEVNEPVTETGTFETGFAGTVLVHNLFVNLSYVVEAKRYGPQGLALPPIQNTTTYSEWNTLTIKFPVYTAFIYVTDSKNNLIEGVKVEAYEWISGLTRSETTDPDGKAAFSLTFGRYRVKVSNGTFLLNETTINLTQDQSSFLIYLPVYNIDFSVWVKDYFGQPISNAMVKIARNTGTGPVATAPPSFTGPDGHVAFSGVLGGDSRISIYVGGQLSGTKDLYLANSAQVTFNLNKHIVIVGNVVETSQFVTAIVLILLVVSFIVAFTYKRLLAVFVKSK